MSDLAKYTRVIPRDLFNEANLLKCLGRLWLELERLGRLVKSANTRHANDGAEASDRTAERLTAKASALAESYGATFSRFGRGSGLWPFVCAGGMDFSI